MPNFNPINRDLVLFSSEILRVNGLKIYPHDDNISAQGRDWLNSDEILVKEFNKNGGDGNVRLLVVDKSGNVVRSLLNILGINHYVGGGNRWCAYCYEVNGGPGITYTDGIRTDGIVPYNISHDGWIAYHLKDKLGLRLCPPERLPNPNVDGLLANDDVNCFDVNNLGGGKLVWQQQDRIHHYSIAYWPDSVKTTIKQIGHLTVFWWDSKWWLLYQENESPSRVVCHPADELIGFRLQDYQQGVREFHRPATSIFNDNILLLAWSLIDNDDIGAWRNPAITLNTPRVNLVSNPVIDDYMIPAFERPMWMAPYFSHHTRYGDTPINQHFGNAIYVDWDDENPARFAQLGTPLIVNIDRDDAQNISENLTVAWYAGAGDVDKLSEKVTKALSYRELPIIAYLDSTNWPDNDIFTNERVWPNIQAYRFPNESLGNFFSRVDDCIRRVAGYDRPMALTTRFDDFNGSSSINNIVECMKHYEQWLRDYSFVVHMPFSDRRGNGIASNEILQKYARAFQYAIPFGRPNRFDYWRPVSSSVKDVLNNKLKQSRASVVLEPYLRTSILQKYENPSNDDVIPKLTWRQVDIIYELWARNKNLAEGNDDERRVLTLMIAQQFRLEFGERYGTKSTTPSHPQSKDGLAYKVDDTRLHAWDWQNGVTREPQVAIDQEPHHLFLEQHFIEVQPINHL